MSATPEPQAAEELRIDGQGTYLVRFTERHLNDPCYLGWLRDYDVMKTVGRAEYLREVPFAEAEAYFRRVDASPDDLFFALHVQADESFIGTVKAGHIDRVAGIADIGIMIGARECWGQGLSTDALHAICRYMFRDFGIRRLTCGAMAVNPAMIRAFEKIGFRREGVLRAHVPFEGGYTDQVLMGCLADDLVDPDAG